MTIYGEYMCLKFNYNLCMLLMIEFSCLKREQLCGFYRCIIHICCHYSYSSLFASLSKDTYSLMIFELVLFILRHANSLSMDTYISMIFELVLPIVHGMYEY